MLKTTSVDMVISDYLMPVMNGGELLKRVHAEYPLIPLIMITGTTKILDDTAVLELADIFKIVSKPWDNLELIETVQNALKKSHP